MNDKILFFGNSITECSRFDNPPLGNGFVAMTARKLQLDPQFGEVKVINSGIGGNQIDDLLSRYQSDVIEHQPNIVLIKIGINDAYNDFQTGSLPGRLAHFNDGYQRLLDVLKINLRECKFMLLTPYYISDTREDPFYLRMCEYGQIVMELGETHNFPVLDTQAIFDEAVKEKPALQWAHDQIHPASEGHALLAEGVYPFIKKYR